MSVLQKYSLVKGFNEIENELWHARVSDQIISVPFRHKNRLQLNSNIDVAN